MVTDVLIRRLRRAVRYLPLPLTFGFASVVHAQPSPLEMPFGPVWIVNGIQPGQVTGIDASTQRQKSPWLRIFRLSDPDATGLECCWHPIGNAVGGIWRKEGDATVELATSQRLTPSHDAPDQPFVGIALAGGDAFVRRTGPLTLEVRWKRKPGAIKIRHCMAQEGMRIQVDHASSAQTYYVPLGMDVEVPKNARCRQDN